MDFLIVPKQLVVSQTPTEKSEFGSRKSLRIGQLGNMGVDSEWSCQRVIIDIWFEWRKRIVQFYVANW